jgi:protoheme IX farnesyltransferase
VVLTVLPFFLHEFSPAYFVAALALNVVLAVRVAAVFRVVNSGAKVDRVTALPLYKYSMTYLALLFLTMALDRALF